METLSPYDKANEMIQYNGEIKTQGLEFQLQTMIKIVEMEMKTQGRKKMIGEVKTHLEQLARDNLRLVFHKYVPDKIERLNLVLLRKTEVGLPQVQEPITAKAMEKVISSMGSAQAEMELQNDVCMNADPDRDIASSDMNDIQKRSEAQH